MGALESSCEASNYANTSMLCDIHRFPSLLDGALTAGSLEVP